MSETMQTQPTNTNIRRAVGLLQTTIDDPFWSPKLHMLRTTTIDDVFTKFEEDGAFRNFDRVAASETGGHAGAPWFDGLIFETMRAAADFLATAYDAELDRRLDGYIERIAAAQGVDADGYLNTYVTLSRPHTRWGANGGDQLFSHEEYNAGCLVEAAVHHYRATGKTTLLTLAVRFADYLCTYMGPTPRHNVVPSHSLPEEALLKLYTLMRDEPDLGQRVGMHGNASDYLDLVRFWIDARGDHHRRTSFVEYAQDHKPMVEQDEAVGHAVRATLLYTGLAALANEIGDTRYADAASRLWQDVTERKMYLTGGAGAIDQYEGFGFGYYLPSDGYNETCAGVGMAFWAGQMHTLFGSAAYADVVERELYNNVLAGISLHGTQYSYQNPLVNHGKLHRWSWHGCPCCPPMLLKLYAGLGEQIYSHDDAGIFVNQYIGSTARVALGSGEVEVRLQAEFPWNGTVVASVQRNTVGRFALRLRVPNWSPTFGMRINGQAHKQVEVVDGYATIDRTWQDGDTLELGLAMPIRRVIAHPSVSHLRDRVALERGPLVYCAEGVDHAAEVVLAADAQLGWTFQPDLLDGVGVITGRADDGSALTAVPYFAWDNRSPTDATQDWMTVWFKQRELQAHRHVLEGDDHTGWEHLLYRPLIT